ncbi:GNAT family N-acetyltransferase [Flagellimonas pacifica]|uniref:Acetyltransferase (GNAT) domain-containing protein n=1 Tax=Flagellimonas pacifica TaxID=1247520 RepID=A0A285MRR0_9FLAO|nr:GNAT family N-acetyltransferase [Allomuricauda parva]SNY99864.1 Acetyltransferase (GNAT) domain-containing protein [Allomuricauda parva]
MDIRISSDKKELDIARIHKTIKDSYWGNYRDIEMTIKTVENSMCFGIYSRTDGMMGFARVLTDKVVFAYIMDLIIFESHRGKGLGKMLTEHIMNHPEIKEVHTIALKTKDAHGLYESFGFSRINNSPMWMAKDNAKYN